MAKSKLQERYKYAWKIVTTVFLLSALVTGVILVKQSQNNRTRAGGQECFPELDDCPDGFDCYTNVIGVSSCVSVDDTTEAVGGLPSGLDRGGEDIVADHNVENTPYGESVGAGTVGNLWNASRDRESQSPTRAGVIDSFWRYVFGAFLSNW